jgi:dynein heavy chain
LFICYVVFIRCRFFLKRAPFSVSGGELKLEAVRPAYAVLDAFHHGSVDAYSSVTAIIEESRQLQELQDLFELYVSDYLMLQRCSEELLYLKSLWDMVSAAGWLWVWLSTAQRTSEDMST